MLCGCPNIFWAKSPKNTGKVVSGLFWRKKKDKPHINPNTPFRIGLRLVVCGYMIIFVIIPMLRSVPEEGGLSLGVLIPVVAVFSAAVVFFAVTAIIDLRKVVKPGSFRKFLSDAGLAPKRGESSIGRSDDEVSEKSSGERNGDESAGDDQQ